MSKSQVYLISCSFDMDEGLVIGVFSKRENAIAFQQDKTIKANALGVLSSGLYSIPLNGVQRDEIAEKLGLPYIGVFGISYSIDGPFDIQDAEEINV